jgi:DNA-binding response OmpR family regulator
VADDDGNLQMLISQVMVRQGYQVIKASDGEQAMDLAARERPDLVVMDVMMPGKDGLEVCRHLKMSPDTSGIKVILLTAKISNAVKAAGLSFGADCFMTKPFKVSELADKVRELLADQPAGS